MRRDAWRVRIQILLPLKTIHNLTFEEDVVTTINLEEREGVGGSEGVGERGRGRERERECLTSLALSDYST